MGTKEKVKMCPFCEGNVAFDAEECRYCGSSFVKSSIKERTPYQTEDSLAGLYDPPYSPARGSSRFGITAPPEKEEEEDLVKEEPKKKAPSPKIDAEEGNKLGSILLLSIGGQLFTLAWLLFFLSDSGKLTLEWKSKYWPLYLLISALFLFQGWKKLSSIKSSET